MSFGVCSAVILKAAVRKTVWSEWVSQIIPFYHILIQVQSLENLLGPITSLFRPGSRIKK